LTETGQIGAVDAVRPSPDGPRIKVKHMGVVPIDEVRLATPDEISNSRFGEKE